MLLLYGICAFMFSFMFLELILRKKGIMPWSEEINRNEAGRYCCDSVKVNGWNHEPGARKVNLHDYAFNLTHDTNSLRITQPLNGIHSNSSLKTKKAEIWVFGCSFTYGWSLNDKETYPWLLQNKLPSYKVLNFGYKDYSTIQSLWLFRRVLKSREKPKYVIVGYRSFHDIQNTLSRSWLKEKATARELNTGDYPYGKVDKEGNLKLSKSTLCYKPIPFMHYSSLIHYLEIKLNQLQNWYMQSNKVTCSVMEEFLKLCKQHSIKLIVHGFDDSRTTYSMLNYCKREGISVIDMAIDLNDRKNTNYPYSQGPNFETNKKYADNLASFIVNCDLKTYKKKEKRLRLKNNKGRNTPGTSVSTAKIRKVV